MIFPNYVMSCNISNENYYNKTKNMTEEINQPIPKMYDDIDKATKTLGFTMASDIMTCTLLRTLAASKHSGKLLELGTGTGLATSWILDGMDPNATLISIDNDDKLLAVAKQYLGDDKRLQLVSADGEAWINKNKHHKFDYIFADTWHGKYLMLDEVLAMLNSGGLYIIDDMIPIPSWPDGHHEKATNLLKYLDTRDDLLLTKQAWATGIVICVKK
jgi:predicted O-methyltransferase YrrM